MAARLVGADPIIGVDLKPKRLRLALKLGATHAIDNRHQDVAAPIAHITGSGVDYVLENTGSKVLVVEKIRSSSLHRQVDRPSPIIIGQHQMHLCQIPDLPSPLGQVNFK